jgi:hypothetical protein
MDIKESIKEIPTLTESVKSMIQTLKEKFMEKVEQSFSESKLKDGTIISYESESLEKGVPLFVLDEAGNRLPAPDGEHVLEDGSVIVVIEGIVSEVKPAEPIEEEEMSGDAAPTAKPLNESDVKRIVETIVKETVFSNAEYVAKFEAIENENKELKSEVEKLSALLKETFSIVEKISAEPSEKPKERKDGFMIKTLDEREKEKQEFRKKYFTN